MSRIFLYLYDLPNATTGLDDILIETATAIPSLTPLLLLFVYFVVFLGGVGRQKARNGVADYPLWSVIASVSTLMMALIMSVVEGLIHLDWLVIIVVVTIFSGIWFFLDKRSGEI